MILSYFSEKHLVSKRALNVETDACAAQAIIRRFMRALLYLMPLMFLSLFNTTAVRAQYPAVPQVIVIDAGKQNPEQQNYRFGDKFPEGVNTPIEVRADGKRWRFIMFEKLPQGISLKVKGRTRGYADNEVLEQGLWYQFKDTLPLELSIDPKATSPVELSPKLGVAKSDDVFKPLKDSTEVREWANVHNDYIIATPLPPIKLYWGVAPVLTPTPGVSPTPEDTGGSEFFLSIVQSRIFIAVVIILLLAFLIIITKLPERIKSWYSSREQKASIDKSAEQPSSRKQYSVSAYDSGKKAERSSTTTAPVEKVAAADISGLEERLTNLRGEIARSIVESVGAVREELKAELNTKLDRKENLYAFIQSDVTRQIDKTRGEVLGELSTQRQQVNQRLVSLDQRLDGLDQKIKDLSNTYREGQASVQSQFEKVTNEQDRLFEHLKEISKTHRQMESRIQQAERSVEEKANDLFYARMLGLTLENRVDVLSEDGFKNLIERLEERLNGFFHNDIPRDTDGLQELSQRVEAIRGAFKQVVEQMTELQADGGQNRQLAERAYNLAAEMSGLQPQLQSRQLEIKTTLHIPVSAHPGARRTFLEELAQGLMREIDKLCDPKNYFENELESLATSDVINLTDICDQRFGRKEQGELEKSLQRLFEQVGLEDILPKPKESFKTSEQELVEMVPGEPQDRLKIAEVLTRGFILKRDGQETLLRKAGVKVYR
jgi:methyl-accepting chemotaxis protein